MKKIILGILLGILGIVATIGMVGFAWFPSVFAAKYSGEVLQTSDGKGLVTLTRLPEGEGPFPTIVVRSLYELPHAPLAGSKPDDLTNVIDADLPQHVWKEVTDAGYALVIQHTRGRVGSEGQALSLNERDDSIELMAWIREQPWSDGKIGTAGDSIEAMLALVSNATEGTNIDASWAQTGTPDMLNGTLIGPGGVLKLETFLPWAAENILTADENHYREMGYNAFERRFARLGMIMNISQLVSDFEQPHLVKAWQHLPLIDYPHYSKALPAWNDILEARPDSEIATIFDATESTVPTYYAATWFDVFLPSQLTAFAEAEGSGIDQRLLIINGTHFAPEDPNNWPIQPMLPWFDYHLKGDESALLDVPRVVFPLANGNDEWFGSDTWPPVAAKIKQWELSEDGTVVDPKMNAARPGSRNYAYDPLNPVPTVGGRNLLITNGPKDQTSVREAKRKDVLSYDSSPLTEDLIVAGHIFGNLSVSSDAPDTDFTVKIMDVGPDGQAILVSEGIQRARYRDGKNQEVFMQDGEVYALRLDLGHIAWRFKKGHRLAIDVSSSNFPQWARNLNTESSPYASTETRIANNIIHHGSDHRSFIELPVIENINLLEALPHLRTKEAKQ